MKIINCISLGEMCEAVLDGEPVFIIRAQDALAMDVVSTYLKLASERNAKNTGRVSYQLTRIHDWQEAHPKRIKVPD